MQPKKPPQKPERELTKPRFATKGEYATPRTEPSAKDRVEQLIQLIREWQPRKDHATAPNGTGARKPGNSMFNDKEAHITEHSIKDRLEQLIDSIRGERITSKYAATIPIRIEPKIPKPFTVQDARTLLFNGCHWSFTASGRELEEKEKATRRRRVKTSKKRDDFKNYPWSVGPATVKVKDYAAVPVGLETVSEDALRIFMRKGKYWSCSASGGSSSAHGERSSSSAAGISNTRSGRTDTSRTPKIYPGFAIGSIPQIPAYYPLLPSPLTSCTGYRPAEPGSERK